MTQKPVANGVTVLKPMQAAPVTPAVPAVFDATTNAPVFKFKDLDIRSQITDSGEILFCANDVCYALGYLNPRKAVTDHVHADDVTKRYTIDALGRKQESNFVNESGLFALIFGSKLTTAQDFKHWVTSEVLPSIRRTGSYGPLSLPKEDAETLLAFIKAPDFIIKASLFGEWGRDFLLNRFYSGTMDNSFPIPQQQNNGLELCKKSVRDLKKQVELSATNMLCVYAKQVAEINEKKEAVINDLKEAAACGLFDLSKLEALVKKTEATGKAWHKSGEEDPKPAPVIEDIPF